MITLNNISKTFDEKSVLSNFSLQIKKMNLFQLLVRAVQGRQPF